MNTQTGGGVRRESFGTTPGGESVSLYPLAGAGGADARIMTYGGIVVSLKTPDRNGRSGDVVLGYDTLDDYVRDNPYFGALVGRYANRIAGGRFSLGGVEYKLARNNNGNHLHGGLKGFDKVVWAATESKAGGGPGLKLTYFSADGEEGYPGNLSIEVFYALTASNELRIEYRATCDRETIVNLTSHSYFNLAGGGDILNHELTLNAEEFTPVDETLIPTGERRKVAGTPMDFTAPAAIGSRIGEADEQLQFAGGYDHNWVLNKPDGAFGLAARVYEPATGRVMEVHTTEPGVQFYSGNFLDGSNVGKGGTAYQKRSGFCLETQHFPDSPNKPQFPTTVLKPGQEYTQRTVYAFSTR